MQTQSLVILALAALGLSSPSFADRGGDGNVSIIYWQAPSILNPYLTGGTKDLESSSLVVEPLGRYDKRALWYPILQKRFQRLAMAVSAPILPRSHGN